MKTQEAQYKCDACGEPCVRPCRMVFESEDMNDKYPSHVKFDLCKYCHDVGFDINTVVNWFKRKFLK